MSRKGDRRAGGLTYGQWEAETRAALEKAGWIVEEFGGFPCVSCKGKDAKAIEKLLDMNLPRGGIKNIMPEQRVMFTPLPIAKLREMFPPTKDDPA